MTNKQRTMLFIFFGTIVSVILTILFIFLLMMLGSLIMKENVLNFLPLILMLAILLSMIIYQKLTVFVIAKWNLEDKLDPIFKTKKRKPRN